MQIAYTKSGTGPDLALVATARGRCHNPGLSVGRESVDGLCTGSLSNSGQNVLPNVNCIVSVWSPVFLINGRAKLMTIGPTGACQCSEIPVDARS